MDYNTIKNNIVKDSLIKVETLQKEYDVTLQQYQEAVKNYITLIQTNDKTFVSLTGRSWWGEKGLAEKNTDSKEQCQEMCANNNKCTGATFNPVKRYCWTREGDASLSVSDTDDLAIIPKQTSALISMKTLNEKLLNINDAISNEFKNIDPTVKQQMKLKQIKQTQLNKSYQHLLDQKIQMEKQLQEYYSIQQNYDNQTLFVNKHFTSMRFWILLTCILIIITLRRMYGSDIPPLFIVIWFFIIIILIVLTYTLNTAAGFVMWSIIIMIIFLIQTGNLSSPF